MARKQVTSPVTAGVYSVADAILANLRSLAKWQTVAAETFVANASLWIQSALTVAQRCGAFNLAMTAYRVGLRMPTDAGGNKVWNEAIFSQGLELAKGRKLLHQAWVHQKYAPVIVPGKDKRMSFWDTIIQLAERGKLAGVDPKVVFACDVSGLDEKEARQARAKVRSDWLVSELKKLTYHKVTNPKGPIAASRNMRLAVRADIPAEDTATGTRSKLSDDELLAELE